MAWSRNLWVGLALAGLASAGSNDTASAAAASDIGDTAAGEIQNGGNWGYPTTSTSECRPHTKTVTETCYVTLPRPPPIV